MCAQDCDVCAVCVWLLVLYFLYTYSGDYGNDEEDLVEDSDSETMDVDLPPSTSGGVKKGAQEEVAYLNEDHLRTSTHSAVRGAGCVLVLRTVGM